MKNSFSLWNDSLLNCVQNVRRFAHKDWRPCPANLISGVSLDKGQGVFPYEQKVYVLFTNTITESKWDDPCILIN